jgi:hypothetical protein
LRKIGEVIFARDVLTSLRQGMLCLADRNFYGYGLWKQACDTGAALLWRVKANLTLSCEKRLPDGSYLSTIYQSPKDQRRKEHGKVVRVIEYRLKGVEGSEPIYRLLTTIVDHEKAPAVELAALYHERWEIETALDELKTHLRGSTIVLRSKTPDLVRQEFYGLMMAHFAIRGLIHEAALKGDEDPDKVSFLHAVRVVRRKIASFAATPPQDRRAFHESVLQEILEERVESSRSRINPRGVKRKMSGYPLFPKGCGKTVKIVIESHIRIIK